MMVFFAKLERITFLRNTHFVFDQEKQATTAWNVANITSSSHVTE